MIHFSPSVFSLFSSIVTSFVWFVSTACVLLQGIFPPRAPPTVFIHSFIHSFMLLSGYHHSLLPSSFPLLPRLATLPVFLSFPICLHALSCVLVLSPFLLLCRGQPSVFALVLLLLSFFFSSFTICCFFFLSFLLFSSVVVVHDDDDDDDDVVVVVVLLASSSSPSCSFLHHSFQP